MYWRIADPLWLVVSVHSQSAHDLDRRRSLDHRGTMQASLTLHIVLCILNYSLNYSVVPCTGGIARKYEN